MLVTTCRGVTQTTVPPVNAKNSEGETPLQFDSAEAMLMKQQQVLRTLRRARVEHF